MRKFGVAVLGLLVGIVAGFILTEVIAVIALGSFGAALPMPLAMLLGFITPVLAVVGIFVALGIDSRTRRPDRSA